MKPNALFNILIISGCAFAMEAVRAVEVYLDFNQNLVVEDTSFEQNNLEVYLSPDSGGVIRIHDPFNSVNNQVAGGTQVDANTVEISPAQIFGLELMVLGGDDDDDIELHFDGLFSSFPQTIRVQGGGGQDTISVYPTFTAGGRSLVLEGGFDVDQAYFASGTPSFNELACDVEDITLDHNFQVSTSFNQEWNGMLHLLGNVSLTAGYDLALREALDGDSLSVNVVNQLLIQNNLGTPNNLQSFMVGPNGQTILDCDQFSSNATTFQNPVFLQQDLVLGLRNGTADFLAAVNSGGGQRYRLEIEDAGAARFFSTVGNSSSLLELATDSSNSLLELYDGVSVQNDITLNGALAIGSGGTDLIPLAGTELIFSSTARWLVDAAGTLPGTGHDQIAWLGAGAPQILGAALDFSSSNLQPGDTLVLMENQSVFAVNGTFDSISEGAVISLPGGNSGVISYQGGDGNDITLEVFGPVPVLPGHVLREYYSQSGGSPRFDQGTSPPNLQMSGTSLDVLRNHPTFPDSPVASCLQTSFELNSFDQADNYGARIRGLFIPRVSGNHVFYLAADDSAELLLSPNAFPVAASVIAVEPNYARRREWTGGVARTGTENVSNPMFLTAGQPYYIEARVKDSGGDDHLAVAVQEPGGPVPENGSDPIPGALLASGLLQPGASIQVAEHPASPPAGLQGRTVTLTSAAIVHDSTVCGGDVPFIQWLKNGVPIPGAHAFSYTTPALSLADDGSLFSVRFTVPGVEVISQPATVLVLPDTQPPQLLAVGNVMPSRIDLCFDEDLNPSTATDAFNYPVNDLDSQSFVGVLGVTQNSGTRVTLLLDRPVRRYSIQIFGVTDLFGNEFNFGTFNGGQWATAMDVIGAAGSGTTTPPGSSFSCEVGDVDVVAGGEDIYYDSDQFHFVHQEQVGDFDVRVKVQGLTPTSDLSKAGLMARETLDGNSANVFACTFPKESSIQPQYEMTWRPGTGQNTQVTTDNAPTDLPNAWIRLKRFGNTFTSYHGTNGLEWFVLGSVTDLNLLPELNVGMAATSHDAAQSTEVEFRNFSATEFPGVSIGFSQQPANVTATQGQPATFLAEAFLTGAPFGEELMYQWYRSLDGGITFQPIPGAREASYTLPVTQLTDGGRRFRVRVFLGATEMTSDTAILTVQPDDIQPELVSAKGTEDFQHVLVTFSEPMDANSATDPFNYFLEQDSNFLMILSAQLLPDLRSVLLQLDPLFPMQPGATNYLLSASDILDLNGIPLAFGSQVRVQPFVISCGFIKVEYWLDVGGVTVADLTNLPSYPHSPDETGWLDAIDLPQDARDNFGARMRGYILPPVSGNYHFFMCSDDQGEFWLSTDDRPGNLILLASEPVWNTYRNYTGTDRRNAAAPENRSSTLFPGGISLVAGQRYYFEARVKEGGGGDHLSVAWQLPGSAEPQNGDTPIGGSYIAAAADPDGADILITAQPDDVLVFYPPPHTRVFEENFQTDNGGFTVNTQGPAGSGWTYQAGCWFANGPASAPSPSSSTLDSPAIVLPASGSVVLRLDHRYQFRTNIHADEEENQFSQVGGLANTNITSRWDGGQILVSVNDGSFVPVLPTAFSIAGYGGPISSTINTLAGQYAFTGSSSGYEDKEILHVEALLGDYSQNDSIRVRLLAVWEEISLMTNPDWELEGVSLDLASLPQPVGTFSVTASGVVSGGGPGPLFYEWEYRFVDQESWSPIPGANSASQGLVFPGGLANALLRARIYTPGAVRFSQPARMDVLTEWPRLGFTPRPTGMEVRWVGLPGWFTLRSTDQLKTPNWSARPGSFILDGETIRWQPDPGTQRFFDLER